VKTIFPQPCPHCGCGWHTMQQDQGSSYAYVVCTNCAARGPLVPDLVVGAATQAWNDWVSGVLLRKGHEIQMAALTKSD
jgi:hypothetical protein